MHKYTLTTCFPHISESNHNKLNAFLSLLLKWNSKINLISKPSIIDADIIHIADGVNGSQFIHQDINTDIEIYDLGSGNGVPGVIYSILYPLSKVIAVDSDQRKAAFLMSVKSELKLRNLEIQNMRVEQISSKPTVFMARGFASIKDSYNFIKEVAGPHPIFYHFKSEDWKQEAQECSTWNSLEIGSYDLITKTGIHKRFIIKSIGN